MRMAETKKRINMKIYILGAKGFIGGNLLKKFNEDGNYNALGYSSKDCNLLSSESIENALDKSTREDIIIMTSCITRLKENSLESAVKNMRMASNVGEFIEKNPINQFIFLSTCDVYGINPIQPINENLLPEPNDYYALSKLASEFILKKSCSNKKIPLLILRLSGVYGRGDDGKSTINKLVKSVILNKKITLFGDGEDKRDYIYVDDLYKIIKEGIKNQTNITLNIATGRSYSIKEIIEIIRSNYPGDFLIEHQKEKSEQKRIKDMTYDVSLLNKTFTSFKPTSLKTGLSYYIKKKEYFGKIY